MVIRIFEEEKAGLEGEPARARVFLKLTGLYLVVGLLLWNVPWIGFKVIGALCLFGAVIATARSIFHLSTLGVIKLPVELQPAAQILIAIIAAIPPFFYFLGQEKVSLFELIQFNFTSWVMLGTTLFIGYLAYIAANIRPALLPVRPYLIAVAVVFVLALVTGHGGFAGGDDDDGGSSTNAPYIDPKSPEGKRRMASNYFRILTATYVGLTVGLWKQKT